MALADVTLAAAIHPDGQQLTTPRRVLTSLPITGGRKAAVIPLLAMIRHAMA
jgi:hypothetical protein